MLNSLQNIRSFLHFQDRQLKRKTALCVAILPLGKSATPGCKSWMELRLQFTLHLLSAFCLPSTLSFLLVCSQEVLQIVNSVLTLLRMISTFLINFNFISRGNKRLQNSSRCKPLLGCTKQRNAAGRRVQKTPLAFCNIKLHLKSSGCEILTERWCRCLGGLDGSGRCRHRRRLRGPSVCLFPGGQHSLRALTRAALREAGGGV